MSRYGIYMNRTNRTEAVRQIQSNQSQPVEKLSNNRTVHIVTIEGVQMPVIYDKKRSVLVTVLPKKALKRYTEQLERSSNVSP